MYCLYIQNVVIGDDTGEKLKTQVIHMIYVAQIIKYCLLAVGAVLVLSGCLLLVGFLCRRHSHSVTGSAHYLYKITYIVIKCCR